MVDAHDLGSCRLACESSNLSTPTINSKEYNIMMFKDRCYNGGNKHKFVPRYTEEETEFGGRVKSVNNYTGGAERLRKMLVKSIYVHDVCEWCGKVIKNE